MSILYFNNSVLQKNYLNEIYQNLQSDIKKDFNFLVVSSHPNDYPKSLKLIESISGPKILFDLGDEWHRVPEYYHRSDVFLILKEYSPVDYLKWEKIIPLPTFYNYKKVVQKPLSERSFLFYSNMWLTPSRYNLMSILKNIENNPKVKIQWNSDFGSGIPVDQYLNNMSDSLITICPDGYMSSEVSKIGDALVCGNIIICSRKNDYPYYRNNAFFTYTDETEILDIIKKIQSMNLEEQKSIIETNNKLFETQYGPSAIAKQITRERIEQCVSS